jgi:dipeptidyl aminopeptidase/acylaminoacyl peptidase
MSPAMNHARTHVLPVSFGALARRTSFALLLTSMLVPRLMADENFRDWCVRLYRPFHAEQMILAPDGEHVAYTAHVNGSLALVLLPIAHPEKRGMIRVADDQASSISKARVPVKMQFLGWASSERVVFVPAFEQFRNQLPTPIYIANADGTNAKAIAQSRDFIAQIMIEAKTPDKKLPGDFAFDSNTPKDPWEAAVFNITGTVLKDTGEQAEQIEAESENDALTAGRSTANRGDRAATFRTDYAAKLDNDDDDNTATFYPVNRPLRILGITRAKAPTLLIEALGQRPTRPPPSPPVALAPTTVYALDLSAGKLTEIGEEENDGMYLYDKAGRPAALYPISAYEDTREFLFAEKHRWRNRVAAFSIFGKGTLSVSPKNYFGQRAYPIAVGLDPELWYFASNVGRDTFAIESYNTRTKDRAVIASDPHCDLAPLDPADADSTLVWDEYRSTLAGVRAEGLTPRIVWVDPEIDQAQHALEIHFPSQDVEILSWDANRRRLVVEVSGGKEPGRYYLWDRSTGRVTLFMRRAEWLHPEDLHETNRFSFDAPTGVHLTGFITQPRKPRAPEPPVVVMLPTLFPSSGLRAFDRESQILAQLGFMVIRVNCRGTAGFGARHRDSLLEGVDRVPIDDAVATVEWVSSHYRIDRKRVVIYGRGFGGYLALRGTQLHPDTFRCAVAINAPMDLDLWLQPRFHDFDRLDFKQQLRREYFARATGSVGGASILEQIDQLNGPVLLAVDTTGERNSLVAAGNDTLRRELRRRGSYFESIDVGEDFERGVPEACARTYEKIANFLLYSLYKYEVKVGEMKVVP